MIAEIINLNKLREAREIVDRGGLRAHKSWLFSKYTWAIKFERYLADAQSC